MRLPFALAGLALSGFVFAAAAAPTPQISVLSNRADLISGGDALVEIKLPQGIKPSLARVALDGVDVTASFAMRPNGRYMGLVAGLRDGTNVLTARVPGAGAQITITNHPIGGPVISCIYPTTDRNQPDQACSGSFGAVQITEGFRCFASSRRSQEGDASRGSQ